ncbi:hypothetical protein ACFL6M_03290 [Candidatus Eisenbacteria bacterium]|uniref:Tetratricopeptide repeat protein n=1 Tax=Eiseniibacteriota bacterium TaxID=2212470 RepID=A0ABV6YK99_UNCEI
MRYRFWIALASLALLLGMAASSPNADGNDAASAAATAQKLLQAGDFQGAFRAYAEAVRTDAGNQEYRQRYAILRQVISLREQIDQERDPKRFDQFARALHSFYRSEGILGEALKISHELHAKQATPETATMLADLQLELGMNDDAAKILAGYNSGDNPEELHVLYGIALARQGKREQATTQLGRIKLPEGAAPGLCYHVARLQALTGNAEDAQNTLTRVFSATPPSEQEPLRTRAQNCPDFTSLAGSAGFAKALATPSQVKESSCSTGTSCGACPSASACPSSKEGSKKPEKPGVIAH